MNKDVFKIVLLLALPASGKSEVRHLLDSLDKQVLQQQFHIGPTLQLDDFPYVNFMRLVDSAAEKIGLPRVFYKADDGRFFNDYDWGTLVKLLNEDYHDLITQHRQTPESAAKLLFIRIDQAGLKVGIKPRLTTISEDKQNALADILETPAKKMLAEKQASYTSDLSDKTIVIEAARGGDQKATMPLTGAFGYQYSLPQFDPEILSQAVILYIWVSPEESRRKNLQRANPNDPGSNLFHGVPQAVMLGDYGCDDMMYLVSQSEKQDTVTLTSNGQTYHLPIGIFDNRVDKTSFLRTDANQWPKAEVQKVSAAIRQATDSMFDQYHK